MSSKDLIAKAADAMKPKPAKRAAPPVKETEPKAAGKEAPSKSKTS